MTDNVRLEMQLSENLFQELERVAAEYGSNISEVTRKGLALITAAHDAKKSGKHLGFSKDKAKLDEEILGF